MYGLINKALRDMVMGGDVGSRRTRALAAERCGDGVVTLCGQTVDDLDSLGLMAAFGCEHAKPLAAHQGDIAACLFQHAGPLDVLRRRRENPWHGIRVRREHGLRFIWVVHGILLGCATIVCLIMRGFKLEAMP